MMAAGELTDRVAIVTGAAQGLGLAVATRFVAEGASVVMADIQADKLATATQQLDKGAGRAVALEVDVASSASVNAMVGAAVSRFGCLDLLVNVAGGSGRHLVDAIDQMSDAVFDGVIAANLRGTFLCCRAAVPYLRRSRDGRILNLPPVRCKALWARPRSRRRSPMRPPRRAFTASPTSWRRISRPRV
jgi:NAD(P)-dependent dehydrogenase (short-subunit alcohol dehydrogenase family)